MSKQNRTKKLTVCAMLCALGVILLWFGAILDVAELSMAVIASLLCVYAVIEFGGAAPWLIFAVTSVLSLILLPNKGPAAVYLLFFGYYPILKEKIERRPRVPAWVYKELVFHSAAVLIFLSWRFLLFPAITIEPWFYVALLLLAEVVFVLYDVALTRLISMYLYRLRNRFRFR